MLKYCYYFITYKVLGNCDYRVEVKKWKKVNIHLEYFKMVSTLQTCFSVNLVLTNQDISIVYIELRQKISKLDIRLHVKNSLIWSCKWNGFKMLTWNNFSTLNNNIMDEIECIHENYIRITSMLYSSTIIPITLKSFW
jgi:hypothetical protein